MDCTPFCDNCDFDGEKATAKGKVIFDVLYETDYKNKIKFCSFNQDFSNSVSVSKSNSSDVFADCNSKCASVGCKLLSPRRIVLKATIDTHFLIEGEQGVKALSINEDGETFFLKKTIGFDGKSVLKENLFKFNEKLTLNQSEKSINEIVCGNVTVQNPQLNISTGRINLKTSALIKALCEEEDNEGTYYFSAKNLPLDFDFESDDIDERKQVQVDLEVTECNLTPETDQYGENRIIKTEFTVKAKAKFNEPKAYTVAEDVFEKHFDSIPVNNKAFLPHLESKTESNFSAETKIPEITPKPTRILDASARDYGSISSKTENGVNISGTFTLTLLIDSQEGIVSKDFPVPYSQDFSVDTKQGDWDFVTDVYPAETLVSLHPDGSVTARIIAGVNFFVYSISEENFVSEVVKRTKKEIVGEKDSLVYCFPQKSETVWSIAKHYRVNPEIILSENPDKFAESGSAIQPSAPILIKL